MLPQIARENFIMQILIIKDQISINKSINKNDYNFLANK